MYARPAFYQALHAFEREGLWGLWPAKRGPRRSHKLSAPVMAFLARRREEEPSLKIADLVGIREAVLRSPAALALGVEAVARQPEVDSSRVVLIGASLGVPPTLGALRITKAPSALVLIDGFADLEGVFRRDARPYVRPRFLIPAVAAVAAHLIRPLEPSLNLDAAREIPTLVINAERDDRLPIACVTRLRDGLPHADRRWRPGSHVRPQRAALIAELSGEVATWLEGLPLRR